MIRTDQAEGLRRLLRHERPRAVVLAGARSVREKTAAVVSLATTLSAHGDSVLLVDENEGPENALTALGLTARHDLLQALTREKPLEQIVLRGPYGLRAIAAAHATNARDGQMASGRAELLAHVQALAYPLDTVLIDAAPGSTGVIADVLCEQSRARELVLVVAPGAQSIVDAYTLLKRAWHERSAQRFGLLVTGVADEPEALAIHRNVSAAATRFLQTTVEFMGYVAADAVPAVVLCRSEREPLRRTN